MLRAHANVLSSKITHAPSIIWLRQISTSINLALLLASPWRLSVSNYLGNNEVQTKERTRARARSGSRLKIRNNFTKYFSQVCQQTLFTRIDFISFNSLRLYNFVNVNFRIDLPCKCHRRTWLGRLYSVVQNQLAYSMSFHR